jgi:hypothetical protein
MTYDIYGGPTSDIKLVRNEGNLGWSIVYILLILRWHFTIVASDEGEAQVEGPALIDDDSGRKR